MIRKRNILPNITAALVAVFLCLNVYAACYIANPTQPVTTAAKIVMVGDSILEQNASGTTRYSWSFSLQDLLNAGCPNDYEIVGKTASPYSTYIGPAGYDLKRIAVGGFNTSGILNWMNASGSPFGTEAPDYVLYYLGVNNTWGGGWTTDSLGYNPAIAGDGLTEWEDDTESIIALARAANPNVTFVIMLLQDMDGISAGLKADFDAINAVAATVASNNTTGSSPVVVTAQPDFVSADLYDGIHPVESGADKIAQTAYDVIQPLMVTDGLCQ